MADYRLDLTADDLEHLKRALTLAIAQQSTLIEAYKPLVVPSAQDKAQWRKNLTLFGTLYRRLDRLSATPTPPPPTALGR